jgi:hypothetical protein
MTDITTRRAIEVCLARVPMGSAASRDLAFQLQKEIKGVTPPRPDEAEVMIAAMRVAIADLSGIDLTFPKAAMISRIQTARERLMWATGGGK